MTFKHVSLWPLLFELIQTGIQLAQVALPEPGQGPVRKQLVLAGVESALQVSGQLVSSQQTNQILDAAGALVDKSVQILKANNAAPFTNADPPTINSSHGVFQVT